MLDAAGHQLCHISPADVPYNMRCMLQPAKAALKAVVCDIRAAWVTKPIDLYDVYMETTAVS